VPTLNDLLVASLEVKEVRRREKKKVRIIIILRRIRNKIRILVMQQQKGLKEEKEKSQCGVGFPTSHVNVNLLFSSSLKA
jgi:hypothetical protein